MENFKRMFLELREKLEEKVENLYNEAEQAVIMEWGMVETMVVSQYFPEKGFGFARSENGKRYFFHINGDVENTGRRREQKILQLGQKIFSFETRVSEKGPQIVRWSENNSFIENKMDGFKKNFRVDETVIRDISQEYFIKNISNEEIQELGPVSAEFRFIISTVGMLVEVNTNAFRISLFGDETTQELFLQMSNKDQIRKVKISTPMPFKKHRDSWRGVVFPIDSLGDYLLIKESMKVGFDGYVIGENKDQYPDEEGQSRGEYVKISKLSQSDIWDIDDDDWRVALLQHKETKILGADATPNVGHIYLSNPFLEKERNDEWVCGYYAYENIPYLKFSVSTEKRKVLRDLTLPILRAYLQDEWTEKYIQDLEKEPEKFFIKKKEHIFSGNIIGEYYFLDENQLGGKNIPSADKGYENFSFLNEEKIISASERILSSRREDFEKEVQRRNYAFDKASLHLRIPTGRERVKNILANLLPGEERIRLFSTEEKLKKENLLFQFLVSDTSASSADLLSKGAIDTQTGKILFEEISGNLYGWFTVRVGGFDKIWGPWNGQTQVSSIGFSRFFSHEKDETRFYSHDGFKSIKDEFEKFGEESQKIKEILSRFEEEVKLEENLLLDTLKSQRALVARFETETKNCFQVPYEGEWSNYSLSEIRKITQNGLNELKKLSECLTPENIDERIQLVKTEAEKIKKQAIEGYTKTNVLVSEIREFFKKILAKVEVNLVLTEVGQIREFLDNAWSFLIQAEFQKAEELCNMAKELISSLSVLVVRRGQEKEAEKEPLGIPEYLLKAFGENLSSTIQFMSNVAKIETWRLDSNELSCGRSRARSTCEDAWSAMGETTDFFCGADPNDVKYYVYEHHFGEEATPVVRKEEKESYNKNPTSNDAMAEALRKAGLVK